MPQIIVADERARSGAVDLGTYDLNASYANFKLRVSAASRQERLKVAWEVWNAVQNVWQVKSSATVTGLISANDAVQVEVDLYDVGQVRCTGTVTGSQVTYSIVIDYIPKPQ